LQFRVAGHGQHENECCPRLPSNYVRELYQWSGVAETVDFYHIKRHYYYSHDMINPTRVVPAGPAIDFARGHNRTRLPANHAA